MLLDTIRLPSNQRWHHLYCRCLYIHLTFHSLYVVEMDLYNTANMDININLHAFNRLNWPFWNEVTGFRTWMIVFCVITMGKVIYHGNMHALLNSMELTGRLKTLVR